MRRPNSDLENRNHGGSCRGSTVQAIKSIRSCHRRHTYRANATAAAAAKLHSIKIAAIEPEADSLKKYLDVQRVKSPVGGSLSSATLPRKKASIPTYQPTFV